MVPAGRPVGSTYDAVIAFDAVVALLLVPSSDPVIEGAVNAPVIINPASM